MRGGGVGTEGVGTEGVGTEGVGGCGTEPPEPGADGGVGGCVNTVIDHKVVPHVQSTGSFRDPASVRQPASHSLRVCMPIVLVRHATLGSALSRTEQ